MKIFTYIGLIATLLISATAQALDWSQDWSDWEVRPRLSTGIMQYQFEQQADATISSDVVIIGDDIEVEDSLLFGEVGVSVFLGNLFIDLSLQKSDEGDDNFSQDVFTLDAESNLTWTEQAQRDMDRQEFSFSIGYALTERLGVFAGYKKNETNFDDNGTLFVLTPTEFDFAIAQSSEFNQDGFFLGTTYNWPFESAGWLNGALSIDVGVAFLNGDLKRDAILAGTGEFAEFAESISGDTVDGDAVGLNLGVAWNGPLTDSLSYSVGLDGYRYDYEADSNAAPDFTDTLLRFTVGVSYAIGANRFR